MKSAVKSAASLLAILAVAPLTIFHMLCAPLLGDSLFAACSQLLSLVPGKTGSFLRIGFYRFTMRACHPNSYIGFGTLFSQRDISIGSGVYIGPQCNIGACRIGADTLIASGVHIMSGAEQHSFQSLDVPIRDQQGKFQVVDIGQDCWIGNGSLVMADLGAQCVIGAGSVVTNTIPPKSIAVGNPAAVVRVRDAVSRGS